MRLSYDADADALSIDLLLDALVARTVQVDAGTLVDLDRRGRVLTIELLRPAREWPLAEIAERFAMDSEDRRMLESLWGSPAPYPFETPLALASSSRAELVLA